MTDARPRPEPPVSSAAESIEPDFAYAADAWMEQELTLAALRHRSECIRIAYEYERRKAVERDAD